MQSIWLSQFKVAPQNQESEGFGQSSARWRMSQHRVAWITGYKGWPTSRCCEQTHAHMYVLQNTCRVEPEDQGLPGVWQSRCCCEHAHVCFRKTIQGCTQGSKLTRDWPTKCRCENTHVCCRVCQFMVAPKCQGLQWFGRSVAAARTHVTCVLQKKSTQGWFGRPHPERRTHMCAAK